MRTIIAVLFFTLLPACLAAGDIQARSGWAIYPTEKPHKELLSALKSSAKRHKMGVVTQAGPTGAARKRGITIPENRVVGVFNNDFAVRILALSTAAMIEAPVRFYVTENENGTATLSYKKPSFVFSPYTDEGGPELLEISGQLDEVFLNIAERAIQ